MKLFASLCTAATLLVGSLSAHDSVIHEIEERVFETIANAEEIPGFKSAEFSEIREGLISRWNELIRKGILEVSGTDADIRPYFVSLQAIVEHTLAQELNQDITSLTGIILTPMPATPLCSDGKISPELVDPTIAADPFRLFTVKARTTIVRDFLHKGGTLYVAYPQSGYNKRTWAQQAIYCNEKLKYSTLLDTPLSCDAVDANLIGAVYLFKTEKGETFAFAIKMTQANNPQDSGDFALWFGDLDDSFIRDRVESVLGFIDQNTIDLNLKSKLLE